MKEPEILEKLILLHKSDSDILNEENEKKSFLQGIEEKNSMIEESEKLFSEKKDRLNDFRKQRADIDVTIKEKEEGIKKKDSQTSEVSTNEAYKALQDGMDRIKKEIEELEDRELKIMEEEEEVGDWIKFQGKEMEKEKKEIESGIKELEEKIKEKEGVLSGKKQERDKIAEGIDKLWYERYERIRVNKDGQALARLIVDKEGNGRCGGCSMTVRPQAVIEVKKNNAIHTCENCARIWYIEEKQEALK